ncbi:hypothetical protein [Secundilactobacillus collinoides]|uniref:Uncharacterized protein n=3 Tax=Secundilactobacillus collinoides TaxID=33960 RepID=A0A0R2B7I1_SECCO|nr:hypothetical protein [Secundilactobacillus collinoides]KRM75002.1 hypothetical protein FC82_GL002743 [Secundilactobacillus collinoides DSM 20515 = JCM 1123]KZL42107.1 hypothetical protein TY91_05080 [Secundilactobacillus collinoides]
MMDDQQHNQAKKPKPKRGWAFYGGWLFFIFFLVKVFWRIFGALGLGLATVGIVVLYLRTRRNHGHQGGVPDDDRGGGTSNLGDKAQNAQKSEHETAEKKEVAVENEPKLKHAAVDSPDKQPQSADNKSKEWHPIMDAETQKWFDNFSVDNPEYHLNDAESDDDRLQDAYEKGRCDAENETDADPFDANDEDYDDYDDDGELDEDRRDADGEFDEGYILGEIEGERDRDRD